MAICPLYYREGKIYQEQFTQLYNSLLRYACYRAGRYFRDKVQRQDAAEEAVNNAVDKWIAEDCYDEEVAKRTIQSSLRQSSRKRTMEPVWIDPHDKEAVEEYEGTHPWDVI